MIYNPRLNRRVDIDCLLFPSAGGGASCQLREPLNITQAAHLVFAPHSTDAPEYGKERIGLDCAPRPRRRYSALHDRIFPASCPEAIANFLFFAIRPCPTLSSVQLVPSESQMGHRQREPRHTHGSSLSQTIGAYPIQKQPYSHPRPIL